MEEPTIYQVILALLAFLGSGKAWSFYEKRALMKERNENLLRDDCRERITKLEQLLEKSFKEKDKMQELILTLSKDMSAMKVQISALETENGLLEDKLISLERENRLLEDKLRNRI